MKKNVRQILNFQETRVKPALDSARDRQTQDSREAEIQGDPQKAWELFVAGREPLIRIRRISRR